MHTIGAPIWAQKVSAANRYYRLIRMVESDLVAGIVVKSRTLLESYVQRHLTLYMHVLFVSLFHMSKSSYSCVLHGSPLLTLLTTSSHPNTAHLYLYPVTAGSLMCG